MMDDAALLRRYAETRDEAAFTELVRRQLDGVYSIALRRVGGDAHLAEDVAQQVFLGLARDAKRLSAHPVLAGWLYTTTRNASANVVRTERRRKAHEQEAHAMHDALSKGPPDADWNRIAPVIEAAVDQLGASDRVAVLLRFVERRPFGEIGAALRLSEDAARKRVDRALEKLRVILGRSGVNSSATALAGALTTHAVTAAPSGLATTVAGTALAGTAGGGGGLTFFTLMSMTKIQAGVAIGIIVVAAIGLVVVQRQNAQLQHELAGLRTQGGELTRLRSENARLSRAEAANRETQSELARLRSEVAGLKNPPPAPPKPAVATKSPAIREWQILGQTTPAAAMETLLAATQDFDIAALGKLIVFDPAKRKEVEEVFARVPPAAREKLKIFTAEEMLGLPWLFDRQGRFVGGEIRELESRGPDDVVMSWKRLAADGQVENQGFLFHRGADGWQWLLGDAALDHQLADVRKKLLREVLGQQP